MAKTRRRKGSGSYDKVTDSSGNTLYRWRIGIFDPIKKKTHYKSLKAKTRAALDAKVEEWKKENAPTGGALLPLNNRMTVQQWSETWLGMIEGKIAMGTFLNYSRTTKRHLIPHFGKQLISQVSPLDLQRYFDEQPKTLSPVTVSKIRTHFNVCFEAAVRLGVISRNPVKQTIPPKTHRPELKIPEESEIERLLSVARSGEYLRPPKDEADLFKRRRNYFVILLAVASGMRLGEILGLTWPCVDEAHATIEIKHSLQDLPNARVLKTPKNGKPRNIPIPEHVVCELKKWREFQDSYAEKFKGIYDNPLDLVFTKPDGGCVNGSNFTEWDFRAMITATGSVGTRFHDLRHFFASSALARGVSVMAVSEHLGHSSINITLERYTHVLEKSRDEMKAMLNANPLFKTEETTGEESEAKNN